MQILADTAQAGKKKSAKIFNKWLKAKYGKAKDAWKQKKTVEVASLSDSAP